MDVEELANAMPQAQKRTQTLEQKAKVRVENNRVFASWMSFSFIGVWILLLQAAGVAFFTKGFLLSRPVFEEHSSCHSIPDGSVFNGNPQRGCWMDKQFDRAVIVIIDALRFDFVVPVENDGQGDKMYHNSFPVLYDYSTKYPENSFLTKFIADPPTTTLQRLKGLTTGSLPTFIDAGSNFAGSEIDEDNWVSQAYALNKSIAFSGDDTWTALFGPQFETSHPYDSLNVHDLHTVDNGVIEHIFPAIKSDAHIAIGHLLGVDHAGHRFGPNHASMRSKLEQMNGFIEDVIQQIDDKTLLVVMGDHGMDPKGDHGGDTKLELESTLWMYSKKKFFGRLPEKGLYDPKNEGESYRQVGQIDLVPTLSLLLGLPIPYNNLGFPISEAFLGPKSSDKKLLSRANHLAASQIHRYKIDNFGGESDSQRDQENDDPWANVQAALKSGDLDRVIEATETYQKGTLDHFKSKWVSFDMTSMYIGLMILAVSLVIVAAYSYRVSDFEPFTVFRVTSIFSALGALAGYLLCILKLAGFIDNESLYGAALGLSIGITVASAQMVVRFLTQTVAAGIKTAQIPSCWTILSVVFTFIHALSFSSNSFTVWEDRILQFLLCTFGVASFARSLAFEDVTSRTLGMWHSAIFVVLTKLSSLSTLCREEQGQYCETTFYQHLSSVSHPYSLFGLALLTLLLPLIIKSFYKTSVSYHGSAPVWIGLGLRIIMGLSALYWIMDGVKSYDWKIDIKTEVLESTKLVVARTALGASLVAANYAWWIGAMCVKVDVQQDNRTAAKVRAAILGYSNVYGSSYFLLILNIFAGSLVVNKPTAGVVLSALVYQILTLLEIIDLHQLQRTSISVIVTCLLGYSYFFSTGHHATIPAIQWEIGFVPTSTITFPFTHLAIALNTFAPVILTILSVPLTVLWKIPPVKTPISLHSRVVSMVLMAALYHGIITLSSVAFTMHFKRHLMLWKIFAPRFMLAGIQLVVVDLIAVFAIAASGKCTAYVHSIFGG